MLAVDPRHQSHRLTAIQIRQLFRIGLDFNALGPLHPQVGDQRIFELCKQLAHFCLHFTEVTDLHKTAAPEFRRLGHKEAVGCGTDPHGKQAHLAETLAHDFKQRALIAHRAIGNKNDLPHQLTRLVIQLLRQSLLQGCGHLGAAGSFQGFHPVPRALNILRARIDRTRIERPMMTVEFDYIETVLGVETGQRQQQTFLRLANGIATHGTGGIHHIHHFPRQFARGRGLMGRQ